METIKCRNCGCIMGAQSERCPQCGCPTEYAETEGAEDTSSINLNEQESASPIKVSNTDEKECQLSSPPQKESEIKNDSKEHRPSKAKPYIIFGLLTVLVISGIILLFTLKGNESSENNTANGIDEIQRLTERARVIFKDVPDHRDRTEINPKVFSKEFYNLVIESHLLDDEMHNLSSDYEIGDETVWYWYTGNDPVDYYRLIGIEILNHNESTANAVVKYGTEDQYDEHQMKLIYEDNEWVMDDWDGKKETLIKNNKEIAEEVEIMKHPFVRKINEVRQESRDENSRCEYFLYDITRDGIPELWLLTGIFPNEQITTYTLKGNVAKNIHEFYGRITDCHQGKGCIVVETSGMGYINKHKIAFNGNEIDEELVYEYYTMEESEKKYEGYEDITDAPTIDFHSYYDLQPIIDAFHLKRSLVETDDALSYKTCPDNHHPHAINLGLPSGTKWACCNVGANSPKGYGNYYAWGETRSKSIYDNDTYYLRIDYNIAGTRYDVATANWNNPWRMPSKTQIEELLNNCTSVWTRLDGVDGRKFIGPNGAAIFFPAAGYRWRGELGNVGSWGYYWSSTPCGENRAYELGVYSNDASWCRDNGRDGGHTVRPVR